MAEKPEEQITVDEKVARAKELIGRGTRNYFVSAYSDAAEDLSQACSIYSDIYGPVADELGHPYLQYAKSLIAVAQDENKLMDIPEGNEDNEDEEEDDDDEEDADDKEKDADKQPESENKTDENKSEKETTTTNGHHEKSEIDAAVPSSSTGITHSEPSSSAAHAATNGDSTIEDKNDEGIDEIVDQDLQVAWEVLELAVKIFERQGEKGIPHLADCYSELANISFENSFFDVAIKDYNRSYEMYINLPEPDRRILAEIKYKIGLCYCMLEDYDQSVKGFKESVDLFDDEINAEKARENVSEEEKDRVVKDLEETKQEILNKMIEVEESKQQSAEEVKKELAKLLGTSISSSSAVDGAGTSGLSSGSGSLGLADTSGASSSSAAAEANKPKALDISHLIKRKKPENESNAEAGAPPAKKPSI